MVGVDAGVDDRHRDPAAVGVAEHVGPVQPTQWERPAGPARRARAGERLAPGRQAARRHVIGCRAAGSRRIAGPPADERIRASRSTQLDGLAGPRRAGARSGRPAARSGRRPRRDPAIARRSPAHRRRRRRAVARDVRRATATAPAPRAGAGRHRGRSAPRRTTIVASRARAEASSRSRRVNDPPRRSRTSRTPIVPSSSTSGVARRSAGRSPSPRRPSGRTAGRPRRPRRRGAGRSMKA